MDRLLGHVENTEGTPNPGDSVETTRGASVDWSTSTLSAKYDELGTLGRTAAHYGVSEKELRGILIEREIPLHPRGDTPGVKKSQGWHDAHRAMWDSPEWREQQRQNWIRQLPLISGPAANSPLEKILHTALTKAGISFSTQRALLGKYVVDILIDQAPVIIEADGRGHVVGDAPTKDAARDAALTAAGYRVFRFAGKPINNDPDSCIRQVVDACGLVPDREPRADIRNGRIGPDNNKWSGGRSYPVVCGSCGKTCYVNKSYVSRFKTCSRECQVQWQTANPPSKKRETAEYKAWFAKMMSDKWADPEWKAIQVAKLSAAAFRRYAKTDGDIVRSHGRP